MMKEMIIFQVRRSDPEIWEHFKKLSPTEFLECELKLYSYPTDAVDRRRKTDQGKFDCSLLIAITDNHWIVSVPAYKDERETPQQPRRKIASIEEKIGASRGPQVPDSIETREKITVPVESRISYRTLNSSPEKTRKIRNASKHGLQRRLELVTVDLLGMS
jgi:hypothetical protein